jgi:hypothetical protein
MTTVPVLTERDGRPELVEADVDSTEAWLAGRYWSVGYGRYLETGDAAYLSQFDGEGVGGIPFVTDPDLVEDFYYAHGHVDFQEYYQP